MKFQTKTCIVGSGVAGSIVAYELLKADVSDVIIVEAGSAYRMGDINEWNRFLDNGISPFAGSYDKDDEYVNTGTQEYKLRGSRLWARGGTTLVWTGHAFRLKPEDFQLYTNTGKGIDWPISYADLEPFYAEAEQTLRVAGDDHDADHPERSGPFPFPPFDYVHEDSIYLETFDNLNITYQHNCISRNRFSIDHLFSTPQCQSIGTCEYCPERARFTGDQLLDYLEEKGVTLLTNTAALRLNFATKQRAVSLKILNLSSGEVGEIEADTFVVCGGGIESPKLLLNSTSAFWEKGVGNDYGFVGKFFTEHAAITVSGVHNCKEKNHRDIERMLAFNTACSRHYDTPKHQPTGKFLVEVADVRAHDLPLKSKLRSRIDFQDLENISPFALCALIETIPLSSNYIELGKGCNRFALPKTVINFSVDSETQKSVAYVRLILTNILKEMGCHDVSSDSKIWWPKHHMGTCRMGNNPETAVVDANLRVHGTQNMFVCSSAVFPNGGAANPTLTIAALAHRLGQHLVKLPL